MTSPPPPPYTPPPYSPQPYVAAPRRPPLPPAMARSARRAGGIGFALLAIGWGLFATGALIGLLWAAIAAIWSAAAAQNAQSAEQFHAVTRWIDTLPVALIVTALVVAAVLGALIWVAGLLLSVRLLRRSGHPRPWAVTWAGLGLGIVASWIVYFIVQIVSQLVGALFLLPSQSSGSSADLGALISGTVVQGVVWILLTIVLDVVAGVLLWWAMAVAMRPGPQIAGQGTTVVAAP